MKRRALGVAVLMAGLATMPLLIRRPPLWSAIERQQLRSLWLGTLPPLPPDPSNRVADDARAAAFGRKLFFDSRLSANGYVSCASCHRPNQAFQDGLRLGKGRQLTKRRTQPLVGIAYSPSLFWDGRKDSLWAQALEPLESPAEHGGHRFNCARTVAYHYGTEYEAIFGPVPSVDWTADWPALSAAEHDAVTRVFVNMGKAIAAYERTLLPQPTRFDDYVDAVVRNDRGGGNILTPDEIAGLKLFIGTADCSRCHNTPLFTDHRLHNTGVPVADGTAPDRGAAEGVRLLREDEFRCDGRWSDVTPSECGDHRPTVDPAAQIGAFKTPSLRGVASRSPYMHAGQYATLDEVLEHYRLAPRAPTGTSEIQAHNFSGDEMRQLIAFLRTLG